jgi:L-ribulose-5-phosphate 4-epimerase
MTAFKELREAVWQANLDLVKAGLVVLTWGNASGVDRAAGVMAIKPSGVDYAVLSPEDIVLLDLETGQPREGTRLRPSSDTPTHLLLYRAFPEIGGVVHTHSECATSWAQAHREIPCLGTTHADQFYGAVPLTRPLSDAEIEGDYEVNTGEVIVERFRQAGLNPEYVPGVLVASHAPFTWGKTAAKAVENAIVLEQVARMALQTFTVNPQAAPVPQKLLDKHFLRKHGAGAYYGQGKG